MGEQMTKTVKLENGHTITFDEDKHVYIHNNEYVVGMSTILKKLASPTLENWKINNLVSYIKKEMEKQDIPLDKIDNIVLNAKSNAKKQNDNVADLLEKRNSTQPIGLPSCGSVFKNPKNYFAAELIESSGLKGYCIGGACVSEKHANYIINQNNATSQDIENLIAHIQDTIKKKYLIDLETELIII